MNPPEGKDRRSGLPGRRDYDGVCAVHGEVRRSDLACMAQLKQGLHDVKEDQKSFVSKWTAGIITTVAMSFLGAIIALSGIQVKNLTESIKELSRKTDEVSIKQSAIVAVQRRAVEEIKDLETDRHKFWSDIEQIKKQLEKLVPCDHEREKNKNPEYSPEPTERTGNRD